MSLDRNLEKLIQSLEAELATWQPTYIDEYVDHAVLNQYYNGSCEIPFKNEAILLSDAYDMTLQFLTAWTLTKHQQCNFKQAHTSQASYILTPRALRVQNGRTICWNYFVP